MPVFTIYTVTTQSPSIDIPANKFGFITNYIAVHLCSLMEWVSV